MSVKTFEFGQNDKTLLYCNGICANYDDVSQRAAFEQQTQLLCSVFPRRKIVVFNNPTGLGEFFTNTQEQREKIQEIADQFKKVILAQIERNNQQLLPIVVHSHGALIAKLALEKLDSKERDQLDVYAFGGVVMLPKSLARRVENYVFKGDLISRNANDKYDPQGILNRIIRVTERSLLEEIDIKDALFAQFQEDWYSEYNWGTEKIPEYVTTFWMGNPETVVGSEDKFKEYASCLRDYNVTVLSSSKKLLPRTKDFTEVTPEMKQSISGFGGTVDKLYHILPNFKPTLEEIAKKV